MVTTHTSILVNNK